MEESTVDAHGPILEYTSNYYNAFGDVDCNCLKHDRNSSSTLPDITIKPKLDYTSKRFMAVFRVAVYGKGGIGKSTVSSNLSYLLSKTGSSVLHIGCDPKHDSTCLISGGRTIRTFSDDIMANPVCEGLNGISCTECGGADPGTGCAGKGIQMLFAALEDVEADYRVYDVLGDVVCGGFSVPARKAYADGIIIVTSGEFMSLFAANNILRGLKNINPGPCVLGIVLNRRGNEDEERAVRAFSEATGLPILADIPRSELFRSAEAEGKALSRMYPDSEEAEELQRLSDLIQGSPLGHVPSPLSETAMSDIARGRPVRNIRIPKANKTCTFDSFDSERNLTYCGDFVMPACTSHGAVDAAMRISDAAVILHGPRNCAFLMEYAFRRRVLNNSAERSGTIADPGLYSTDLDASETFVETRKNIGTAVSRAKEDGYGTMFLVPSCTSEIMSTELGPIAAELSREHGVEVIPVSADGQFLSSKFGGTIGLFETLIRRMSPKETVKGSVNLIARWFYGLGKDRNTEAIGHILDLLDLRVGTRFLDFCRMADIEDFCSGEMDIQIGRGNLNSKIADRISKVTGRRRALIVDVPTGLCGCLRLIDRLEEYAPWIGAKADAARASLRSEFESMLEPFRPTFKGKRVVIYCIMARDLEWQVETLRGLGVDISAILFADGGMVDHDARRPDYGDIKVIEGSTMCDLRTMMASEAVDMVVTNDPDRVSREGWNWGPLGSRWSGLEGPREWICMLADSLRVPAGRWEAGL